MRFVSVARQRNIYRVYSTTSAHVAPTASNHGNPRPDTRSCLSQITRERERTTKPLPISHTNNSSPVSKIVSNRYSKEKKIKKIEIIISYFRDTKRACLLSHLIGKLGIDRGKDRALFFFESLSSLLSRGERTRRERCVDDRYFYRSDATSLPPLEKFIFAVTNAVQEGTEQPRRRHRLRHCLRLRRCLRERGSTRLARFAKAPSRNRTPK